MNSIKALVTAVVTLLVGGAGFSPARGDTFQVIQPVAVWGTFGNSSGQFHQPRGIAVDPNTGNVLVMDSWNNRVQTFGSDGVFVSSWGMFRPGDAGFYRPTDLHLDPSGRVIISHELIVRVNVFTQSGQLIGIIRTLGNAFHVTNDEDGSFYISVESYATGVGWRHQIEKLSASGQHLLSFGSTFLSSPSYGILSIGSGEILVSDTGGDRIHIFDKDGNHVGQFAGPGEAPGLVRSPRGMAMDPSGNIYVADTGNQRIQVFDRSGTHIDSWGRFGTEPGEFRYPWDLAVDSSGDVYVTDAFNHRIQKFAGVSTLLTSTQPSTWGRMKFKYLGR